jgi:hypothetical protein
MAGADDGGAGGAEGMEEEEEGPAARAVRQIEEKLMAAEDDAYTGDVEEPGEKKDGKPGSS